jgi:hypothetical protein
MLISHTCNLSCTANVKFVIICITMKCSEDVFNSCDSLVGILNLKLGLLCYTVVHSNDLFSSYTHIQNSEDMRETSFILHQPA